MGSPRCLSRRLTRLYRVLAQARSITASDVAGATGAHVRYLREWLEQQAASGILEVEDAATASDERRDSLSPRHVEALLDMSSLNQLHRVDREARGRVHAADGCVDGRLPLGRRCAVGPTPCVATAKADLESFEVLPIENDFFHLLLPIAGFTVRLPWGSDGHGVKAVQAVGARHALPTVNPETSPSELLPRAHQRLG
jgi:hypothetical protein